MNFPYTSPVGSFAANGYGLVDMMGNVEEWIWDRYGTYPAFCFLFRCDRSKRARNQDKNRYI